jgi:hypothetical protein
MIVKKTKVMVTRSDVLDGESGALSKGVTTKGCRHPGFPVEVGGVGKLHPAFFTESRTPGR